MINLLSRTLCLLITYTIAIMPQQQVDQPDPLLVVILMVKNEEEFMEKTLAPFLESGIDSYLILDTGSTDATITKTRQLFLDYAIAHGHIIEQPFIDFATSRNYALECAQQLFPNAGFFFMIDAEWYTQNVKDLLEFCKANYNDPTDAFAIRICYQKKEYYVRRLFPAQKKIRFIGVVHEYAQVSSYKNLPANIFIKWNNSQKGLNKSTHRWHQDKELLLLEHKKDPTNLRTMYYLGQTYFDLQEFENAAFWYKKRYELDGWLEEKYLACYRLANVYERLQNWPLALQYYKAAHDLNPNHAEPLIRTALYYLQQSDYQSCFFFAQQATEIPYPQDAIITDEFAYSYTRHAILACAAWHLKEYEIGERALLKLLEHFPDDTKTLEMLQAYQNCKSI